MGEISRQNQQIRAALKEDLNLAKRIYISLDIWTKQGLSESYMGVTATFFSQKSHQRRTVVLAVREFPHPHRNEDIFEAFNKIREEYEIPPEKVLRVYSDNGKL